MEAHFVPVKPRQRPLATFSFRGVNVAVELTEDGGVAVKCRIPRERLVGWIVTCGTCGTTVDLVVRAAAPSLAGDPA